MEIRQATSPPERREALELLVGRPGLPPSVIDQRIESLQAYVRLRDLSLDYCYFAIEPPRLVTACLCLDSPGRLSSIVLSPGSHLPEVIPIAASMLRVVEQDASQRGIQLLQGMVAPEAEREAHVYAAAGFRHLAKLLYLESEVARPSFAAAEGPKLSWVTYTPETQELFARVIEASYEDSLDCGPLNGIRSIEDVMASHRATGRFDPAFWLVALVEGQPVGVVLLSYMAENPSFEVVYMGLLPAARRRRYGQAIMQHAGELARREAIPCLTLSVDEKNLPARRLYSRFGFVEVTRRDVWMRVNEEPESGI